MRFVVMLALTSAPAILSAQQPIQPPPHSVITGVAVDSLRGGYLRGAIVAVSGTTLSGMTDSAGRFRVDSVPPGTRYLEVMHPLLDSIALTVRSPIRVLSAGDTTTFILSVPSAATIVGTKCPAQELARGSGAVVGFVNDAGTNKPSAGAVVSVEWLEYQMGRRSMNRLPQRRFADVRPDGSYRVCGIPDDLTTGVIATRGADSTGAVAVNFANRLAVVSFHLPAPAVRAASTAEATDSTAVQRSGRGSAILTGKVIDASGAPLANARVAVEADEALTTTDNQGAFRLTGLRAGTRSLSVRRIGFAAADVPVDVKANTPGEITVTLSRYVTVLDEVRISAMRDIGLQRVGFSDRQKSSAGKFFGPADIAQRNPQRLSMLLETAGGALRMATNAEGKRYVTGRHNGCVGYFVDGFRWFTTSTDPDLSPDAFLSGGELGAVEVYDELSTPPEYSRYSSSGMPCAVVVIWTKQKLGG